MPLWPALNVGFIMMSAILVSIGWYLIRRGDRAAHRHLMLAGSIFGAAFLASYSLRTIIVGDTAFGGPARFHTAYNVVLGLHILLATAAGILGMVTWRRALLGRFALHRRIAPYTAVIWLAAAASGFGVFILLYLAFSPGMTLHMMLPGGVRNGVVFG